MAKFQLLVQLLPGTAPKWHLSENPAWIGDQSIVFTPPLAADQAWMIWLQLDKHRGMIRRLWAVVPWPRLLAWYARRALHLRFSGYPRQLPPKAGQEWRLSPDQKNGLVKAVKQLLEGRLIPDFVLEKELRAQGWWPADIRQALDWGLREGQFGAMPGAQRFPWGELQCSRCMSLVSELRPCTKCGRLDCPVCTACVAIGEIRGCTCLWFLDPAQASSGAAAGTAPAEADPPQLELCFELTAAQAQASRLLVQFMDSSRTQALVWAACGAGKTEVTFAAIQAALARGMHVLFAIPRRDVVRDLAERLTAAFPGTRVAVHYGGRPWQQEGPLVIATTHQALRFYRRFGLVILDEVDAYPYHGSEMLRVGVERSLIEGGKLIEMTATPHRLSPGSNVITIPARYHGYPLPEPQILKIPLPGLDELADRGLPPRIMEILAANKRPWLIFSPTVAAVRIIAGLIGKALKCRVCCSWAGDRQRDQKIDGFASGQYEIMVATSIMERGVTLANVQVMVLYSDHVVFDANSLIQMAGRVGRKAEHPNGEVWFIGTRVTEAMQAAIKRIQYLNQQAFRQGLLKGDACV